MIFIVLSFLETVHDTLQYRDCVLSLFSSLLMVRLERQKPLLSYLRVREKKYTVNVQCNVYYISILFYIILVISYCA